MIYITGDTHGASSGSEANTSPSKRRWAEMTT